MYVCMYVYRYKGREKDRMNTNLNKEEIHHHKLNDNPPHIEEIVLPRERIDTQRIYICVECPRGASDEPEKGNAFGADRVGEDFDDCVSVSHCS